VGPGGGLQHFFETLTTSSSGLWRSVQNVTAIGPGDIIAWTTMPGSKARDTGMVMMMVLDVTLSRVFEGRQSTSMKGVISQRNQRCIGGMFT